MPLISHSTFPSLKVLAGHLPAGSVGAVRSKELCSGSSRSLKPRLTPAAHGPSGQASPAAAPSAR